MATESHFVELIFDTQTGELADVHALLGGGRAHDKREVIDPPRVSFDKQKHAKDKQGNKLNKSKKHELVFAYGSPGCVIYRTSAGLIRICW
jgi:hypothetical protein